MGHFGSAFLSMGAHAGAGREVGGTNMHSFDPEANLLAHIHVLG